MEKKKISRKAFFSRCAVIGAAGAVGGGGGLLSSCSSDNSKGGGQSQAHSPINSDQTFYIPKLGDKAIDGKALRVGVIGCGGRGTGAARNLFDAANGITTVALADLFPDRIKTSKERIEKHQGVAIDDKNVHVGFDAYKNVCDDPNVDVVIIASHPVFHAYHTKYAIDKGKHVFCEKPAGIDAVSCRTMMAAIKAAQTKGLCIQMGTQRHHSRGYNEAYKRVREGEIGRIQSAVVKWNQGYIGYTDRKPGWTDMEYMLRDFNSWKWLNGDHIAEQMCHNIDVFQWFSHLKPVSVVAMGSQLRRQTGDVFDNFSMDITYEGGVRVHGEARQIAGCQNDVSEVIFGSLGSWNSKEMAIRNLDGEIVWQFDKDAEEAQFKQTNPYVLEHVDLVNHIRSNKPLNTEAETSVISSLTAAIAREAAYTGKEYKYDEYMASSQSYMPEKLHMGNVKDFKKVYVVSRMGTPPVKKKR